jgi:GNAT superfamily N-acetyltransferase
LNPPIQPASHSSIHIRAAAADDCALILRFIEALADYEKLRHLVVATEDSLRDTLFGERPAAEVIIAYRENQAAGFALFFPNYSTFLGRPGIYLEDLFVFPEFRGLGLGKALLKHLAALVVAREGGRLDWSVLDSNQPSIDFYRSIGAIPLDEWTQFRLQGDALRAMAQP